VLEAAGRLHRWARGGTLVTAALASAAFVASCSAHPTPSATGPGTPSGTPTPATTVTNTTAVTTPTVPLQTARGGEFLSPTKNISCEIDDGPSFRQVYCETITPPRSVTMTVDGHLTKCAGQVCLSNAGEDTPTLPYGSTTGMGPFRCTLTRQGMSCTISSGRGFEIAIAGITAIGN
jgi:hypothetical protein